MGIPVEIGRPITRLVILFGSKCASICTVVEAKAGQFFVSVMKGSASPNLLPQGQETAPILKLVSKRRLLSGNTWDRAVAGYCITPEIIHVPRVQYNLAF